MSENFVLVIIAVALTVLALLLAFVIGMEIVRIVREIRSQATITRRSPSEPEATVAPDESRSRATRMRSALQRGATSLEGERERGELSGE